MILFPYLFTYLCAENPATVLFGRGESFGWAYCEANEIFDILSDVGVCPDALALSCTPH